MFTYSFINVNKYRPVHILTYRLVNNEEALFHAYFDNFHNKKKQLFETLQLTYFFYM